MKQVQVTPNLHLDYEQLLGKGSTGNVYRGTYTFSENIQIPVAVKIIPLSEINNEVVGYLLQCQLEALKLTSNFYPQNPNKMMSLQSLNSQTGQYAVVQLFDIMAIQNNCYIVMQLLEGGTLKQYIGQKKKIQEQQAIYILNHLLNGYKEIKNNKIVHRDLKPENIIFVESAHPSLPKIIDFGYCQVQNIKKPNMFYNVGSPRYMSPQAYTDTLYSQKSDIWALGIVFYEMVTGTNFDKGKQVGDCFKEIREKGIPIPANLKPLTKKLLQKMLMFNPKERESCEGLTALINNQPIQEINEEEIVNQNENKKNAFVRHSMGHYPKQPNFISPPKRQTLNNTVIHGLSPENRVPSRLFNSGIQAKPKQTLLTNKKPLVLSQSHQKDRLHFRLTSNKRYMNMNMNGEQIKQIKQKTQLQDQNIYSRDNNKRENNININTKQLLMNKSEQNLQKIMHAENVVRINNRVVHAGDNNILRNRMFANQQEYPIRIQKSPINNRERIVTIPNPTLNLNLNNFNNANIKNGNGQTPRIVPQQRPQITINSMPYRRSNNQNQEPNYHNQHNQNISFPLQQHQQPHQHQHQHQQQQQHNTTMLNSSKQIPLLPPTGIQFHPQSSTPTNFPQQNPRLQIHFNLLNPTIKN